MKIFTAYYNENVSCHCHPEYETAFRVVVAEDELVVKNKLVAAFPDYALSDWTISEISTDEPGFFDEYGDKLD